MIQTPPDNILIVPRLRLPPGVELGPIRVHERVEVDGTGWGPSFHRYGMRWSAPIADQDLDTVVVALQPFADIQHRRRSAAIALGMHGRRPPIPGLVGHIKIDRLVARHLPHAAGLVEYAVGRLEDTISSGLGVFRTRDAITSRGSITLMDGPDDDPHPRALIRTDIHHGTFDGEQIAIDLRHVEGMPESMIVAMAGRRVGEVLDEGAIPSALRPLLGRTILSASRNAVCMTLETCPDWIRLDQTWSHPDHAYA